MIRGVANLPCSRDGIRSVDCHGAEVGIGGRKLNWRANQEDIVVDECRCRLIEERRSRACLELVDVECCRLQRFDVEAHRLENAGTLSSEPGWDGDQTADRIADG